MPPSYTLHLGDCLPWLESLEPGSADAIITDPPYGQTACDWDVAPDLARMWAAFDRVLKPEGVAVVTAMQPFTTDLINAHRKRFRYALCWDKVGVTGWLDSKKRPLRGHEDVLVFARGLTTYNPQMTSGHAPYKTRGGPRKATGTLGGKAAAGLQLPNDNRGWRYPRSVLRISSQAGAAAKFHPTQKPVELMEWLVRTYTDPGDLVVDPYGGSGSVGVASVRNGRRFAGAELSPEYHAKALARIRAEADAQPR